ncbi:hypothetical protein LA429_04515 [Weissella cibaria]|uniref:hypothetical protein n=1 Tax=Weissella cibaria TaxID=137591 RepID=UPI001E631F16|nr:hypothetical protein [Weissella cibaria]MCC6122000.1 hypothetical protein [Weissella cibaria]MCT0952111.1 hypothetical protein [Weissella cibaria]MCT0956156.1 hypothetical protein [Weissella cibaria]
MKPTTDERIIQKDNEVVTRSFVFLVLLLMLFLVFAHFFKSVHDNPEITIFTILIATLFYSLIDFFISKTLFADVQDTKDLKLKLKSLTFDIIVFNIVLIGLSMFHAIDLKFSGLFLIALLVMDIVLFILGFIILKLWLVFTE